MRAHQIVIEGPSYRAKLHQAKGGGHRLSYPAHRSAMLLAALLMLVVGIALLTWAGVIADYLAQVYRPYADRWAYARFNADANKTRPVFRLLGVGFVVGAVIVLIGSCSLH